MSREDYATGLAQDRHDRRRCEGCDDDETQTTIWDGDWGRLCPSCLGQMEDEAVES